MTSSWDVNFATFADASAIKCRAEITIYSHSCGVHVFVRNMHVYYVSSKKTEARLTLLLKESLDVFIRRYSHFITRTYSFRAAILFYHQNTHTIDYKLKSREKNQRNLLATRPLCDRVTKTERAKSMMAFNWGEATQRMWTFFFSFHVECGITKWEWILRKPG